MSTTYHRTDAATAQDVVDQLKAVCTEDRLAKYVADDSGNDSLESYRSAVVAALQTEISGQLWEQAMELLGRSL